MYEHRQSAGVALPLLLGVSGLIPLAILFGRPRPVLPAGVWIILALATLLLFGSAVTFSSLTTRVAEGHLAWYFGPRLLRWTVPLSSIADVTPTSTSWLEGWGIHFTMRGWLYNVAGRRAVLVTRRDGRRFLIGTDEPEALAAAIRAGLEAPPGRTRG